MEDQNRLAMESGTAAFELNYPFVYPSMKENKPNLFKNFKWAQYPSMKAGEPSQVTIGGIDLAVSSYSKHPDLAFEAALCMRNRDNQKIGAIKGGLPPSIADLYDDPSLQAITRSARTSRPRCRTRRASADARVPEHLDRHLPLRVATFRHQAGEHGAKINSQIKDALSSKGLVP